MSSRARVASNDDDAFPVDWQVEPLARHFDFRNGYNADRGAYGHGVPFINVLEVITHPHLDATKITGRVAMPDRLLSAYEVRRGDSLFNRSSETQDEVALSSVYLDDEPVVYGGFVIRGRSIDNRLDPRYAGYALRSHYVRRQAIARGQGGIRANVGQADLKTILIPLPELPEQRAIANHLTDLDALLSQLGCLIAKKRDITRAVMQQLLTGRTRLPGHVSSWVAATLGGLGRWFSGGTPALANEQLWAGSIPWVSPKDMKVTRISDSMDHVSQSAIGRGTRLLPAGAVLVVVRGMILAHSAPVARAERPVAFNQDIKGLVVNTDVDSEFMVWWLVAHERRLLSICNESTHGTKRIPTDELFKMSVELPPTIEEQRAIAEVISDLDAEIVALEKQREKMTMIKLGMIQVLLTGKTRLV